MATYTFLCEQCNSRTELRQSIHDPLHTPRCNDCDSSKHMIRDFESDIGYSIGPPKTLGSFADKNSTRLSEDEKQAISKKNKTDKDSRPMDESLKTYKPGE